jgi:hypothetical protein
MKGKIKYLYSADADDLENYIPMEKDNFMLGIEMVVCPIDDIGEEVFQFILCTPKYLSKQLEKEVVIFGRHYIIVREFNYTKLENKLNDFVNSIDEPNWDLLTEKINRIAQSEFEDYQK